MSSTSPSMGGGDNKMILFSGKEYSIEMTWKYLEFLSTKLPEQFGCVSNFKGRDIGTLEALLKSIEATTSVHRSQIFTQVSNAMARNQHAGNRQQQHQQQHYQQANITHQHVNITNQQSHQQAIPRQLQVQQQQNTSTITNVSQ